MTLDSVGIASESADSSESARPCVVYHYDTRSWKRAEEDSIGGPCETTSRFIVSKYRITNSARTVDLTQALEHRAASISTSSKKISLPTSGEPKTLSREFRGSAVPCTREVHGK